VQAAGEATDFDLELMDDFEDTVGGLPSEEGLGQGGRQSGRVLRDMWSSGPSWGGSGVRRRSSRWRRVYNGV